MKNTASEALNKTSKTAIASVLALTFSFHFPVTAFGSDVDRLALEKAENKYQICLKNSQYALTNLEKNQIVWVRADLTRRMTSLRPKAGGRASAEYGEALGQAINEYTSKGFSSRVMSRVESSLVEERFLREVATGPGVNNAARLNQLRVIFASSIYDQKPVDLDALEALHQQIIGDLIVAEQNDADRRLGSRIPLALAPADASRLAQAVVALNMVMETILHSQVENKIVSKDRSRLFKARMRQAAFAVGGMAILFATIKLGPPLVAGGGALTTAMGLGALTGETGASMTIGAVGGAAAEGVKAAYEIVSRAYFRSLENATPFNCELQKSMETYDQTGALKHGALFGVTAGGVGTVIANFIPKITLWLLGGAVVVGQVNETGQSAYHTYKAIESYRLADALTNLSNVPQGMQAEQLALVKEALNESHRHAHDAGEHAVASMIVGLLTKAFYVDGEFKHALHEGKQMIKSLMAYSADTVPSVAMAVGGAAQPLVELATAKEVPLARAPLADRVDTFMKRLGRTNTLAKNELETLELQWTATP